MLILPIKKKWFDMIERREKKEEYREDTPYWRSRFFKLMSGADAIGKHHRCMLRNGYGKDKPTLEIEFILEFRKGLEQWGAEPGKKYFVLVILDVKRVEG